MVSRRMKPVISGLGSSCRSLYSECSVAFRLPVSVCSYTWMYFAKGSHPAIVSIETFEAAQQRLERNRLASCAARDTTATHPFTGMIVCDKCGKKCKRVTKNGRYSWNCSTYQTFGKAYCHTKKIPEDILMETTAAAMGMADFDEHTFLEKVQEIHVPAFNHLVFCFKDGTTDWLRVLHILTMQRLR